MNLSVGTAAACALAALWTIGCPPASASEYSTVTEERLRNPEPENWLSWRGNDAGWGYSPLEQITSDNVKDLVPVWSYATGLQEGHQAPPIVNNGITGNAFKETPTIRMLTIDLPGFLGGGRLFDGFTADQLTYLVVMSFATVWRGQGHWPTRRRLFSSRSTITTWPGYSRVLTI